MPRKGLKPCTRPGCRGLTNGERCTACGDTRQREQRAASDARRAEGKGTPWYATAKRWYASKGWRVLRARQLAAEPLCAACRERGMIRLASQVDHVVPHRGVAGLFFDETNLQSLCRECHSSKTGQERVAR